jgi:hypothetical protein
MQVLRKFKFLYEALMGGRVYRDAYKGKFLLDINDVVAKLMTRLENSWARLLMERKE